MKLELHIPVPLKVTINEARDRMRLLLVTTAKEMDGVTNIQEVWTAYRDTFSFTAKGYNISGTMDVGHNDIIIRAELPWLAGMFKGKISDTISKHALALLK